MRGFDYRSKDGIALMLCTGFNSEKAKAQALGRVGRYEDDCVRVVDNAIGKAGLVDRSKNAEMCARITATMKSVRRAKKERDDAAALEKAKADAHSKISQKRINNLKYAKQKMYFAEKKEKEQVAAAATLMIEEQTA